MKQPKCGKHGGRIGKIAPSNSQILDGSAQFKDFEEKTHISELLESSIFTG